MPELPEVETVVRELRQKLIGRKIQSVLVKTPKLVAVGYAVLSPKRGINSGQVIEFVKALNGQKFLSVTRRAKLLFFKLSNNFNLIVHLKMTGQFIFEDEALRKKTKGKYRIINKLSAPHVSLPSKHTHVIFAFNDKSKLFFNDVRKFGYLKLVRDYEIRKVKELKEFGPEPLSKEFTKFVFFEVIKKRKQKRIKEVLVDPKVIAGIGNIYSDEILFLSGVRPERKSSSLKNIELEKIYQNIKIVLKKAIQTKGSSVGDFIRTDGSWGKMGKYHYVYGRKGQKCKKCGNIILAVKMGGRTASYCPKCQK